MKTEDKIMAVLLFCHVTIMTMTTLSIIHNPNAITLLQQINIWDVIIVIGICIIGGAITGITQIYGGEHHV